MEDDPDIDIEEITLMYPRIESIYSDVNIKTEPIDIDEEDFNSIEIAEGSSQYYMPFPNKIILGSKPPSLVQSEPTPGPSTASDNWEDEENLFECAECNIFFPTLNELDSHKTASHSFLVARPISRAIKSERISVSSTSSRSFLEDSSSQEGNVLRRQKAVKSTSKSALNKTFPTLQNALRNANNSSYRDINPIPVNQMKDASDQGDKLLCKHCDVRFPDEIALIKHTYELLPATKFESQSPFDSQIGVKDRRAKNYKKTDDIVLSDNENMLQCMYCTCFMIYPGYMKKHLMNNHKVTEYAVKYVKFTGKCAICSDTIKTYKQYNNHVLKYHRKIFMSRTPYRFGALVKMKCLLCNQIFTSRYSAYKHKAEKHPEHSQKQTFLNVYDKPIKQLPVNTQTSYPKPQALKNPLGNTSYIPKQNIFKCNKCQIHFVSCSAAFAHSKRCSLAKGDWKCNKCRRTFTKIEKYQHMQQHQFSEKFVVHVVCDKILSQVLCRCPKCELLFDELAFGDHIAADCIPKTGVECKSCNLKIHSDSYAKHRRYHSKYNFSSDDFILIDFVDASFQNTPVREEKKGRYRQALMYCTSCTCHFYKIKSKLKYHLEQKCESLSKRFCTVCGLTFSRKPYMTHVRHDHATLKLKLDEIKFVRIQDSKVINPVIPNFIQCSKCEVRFISPILKSSHNCSKQVFIKCTTCSQKYDSVTYDIHLAFHNYGRSKTEGKSSAVELKFYSCVTCSYGFHSYDDVVYHCQKHYTNTEDLVTKHCKMCYLNYADNHKLEHPNRAKFQILKFDSEKLLTDNWLDGFGSLPKNEVEDILSKSIYGVMRNVRLDLLVEGPAERTLYKCAQCELNIDQNSVLEHTTESCSRCLRFECSSCTAVFRTRSAKNNHMNIHVVYGDDITFREIIFNNVNDRELNEALRTGRQKESLKFRKCQQCKLLIKKSDYQAHVSAHDAKAEIKQFKFRRNNKLITYKMFKPINTAKKLFTVYKCKTCNACIMKKANMHRHKCSPPDRYEKCGKCSLHFLAWNIKRHIAQHAVIPKFVPKNISILEFQLLDNSEIRAKKRRRYSSDDDASTGSQVNVAVSKTYDTRKVRGRPYSDNLSEDSQDNVSEGTCIGTPTSSNAYAKKYIKKNCVEKVNCDNEIEESPSKPEYSPGNRRGLTETVLDIEMWRIHMKNKLYQCERCYLCFAHKQLLVSHLLLCDENNLSETPLFCDQCDIAFHPSMLSFHEKLHDLVKQNPIENYFYLINVSTNGVNTNNERRWLYKCKVCDIQYLNTKSLATHFSSDHVLQEYFSCEVCGLKFTQRSRTRHMRLQHNESNWSKDDLHIEITQKKIVNLGEIRLTALIKGRTRDKVRNVKIEEICNNEGKLADDTLDLTVAGESDLMKTEHLNGESNVMNLATDPDEKEVENNNDIFKVDTAKIDHNLYKCEKCFKHYLTKLTLARHILNASHKARPLQCDSCGLLFGKRTLNIHKSMHHGKLKLNREDFVIATLKINHNDNGINEEVLDSGILNTFQDQIETSDISIDSNTSRSEEQNEIVSKEIKNKLRSSLSSHIDNHIYKCVECSIYYTNRHTLLLHIIIRKHKQSEFLKCDVCGLVFGKGSLQKHKNIQHEKLKLTRKDFIITDVFGSRLVDDENNDIISIKNSSELEDKEVHVDKFENTKGVKIFRMYQCKDCRICVQKSERKLHVCCSNIRKKQCIKCCLLFSNTDIVRHNRLHRIHSDLSRKNIVLHRFGRRSNKNQQIFKCVSCSTHFVSLTALEWHMNALNHQTKRENCKICGLIFGKCSLMRHVYVHHKMLDLKIQQFNIVYVSDTDKISAVIETDNVDNVNNSINTSMSEPEGTINVKTIKKLFKCAECDVHFLTRAAYYQHIYKHRKLDATEYIDCNICDFQFLNESLGIHMKTHKDKSFCLDKLLIEEYQPNSTETPKIEFYFAKDSINSKLVTTTTPFDNEDESVLNDTDEQLSVIDSTSDEIPKPKVVEILDVIRVNESTDPPNSDSNCEEDSLDPIVASPNLDVSAKLNE